MATGILLRRMQVRVLPGAPVSVENGNTPMSGWEPIETAPENTDILVWSSHNETDPYFVDRFVWVVDIHEEVQSETRNAKGRRRVIQEREERRREWERSWGAEYWMPLPAPPALKRDNCG